MEAGDIYFQERRRRSENVKEDNEMYFSCESRSENLYVVGECSLCNTARNAFISQLVKIIGCDRGLLRSWDCEKKALSTLF